MEYCKNRSLFMEHVFYEVYSKYRIDVIDYYIKCYNVGKVMIY